MDDIIIQSLEKLFYKKIMLYNDLLRSLNMERESLVDINLDRLWQISKEKEEISSKIISIRQEIISVLDLETDRKSFNLSRIPGLVPREARARFHELYRTLITLKSEVEILRKENMIFVDDSLHFLDEMISIITGESGSGIMYNDKCHFNKSGAHALLNREV